MSLKETAIKLTCVVLMLVCFVLPVSADWYSDIKSNSTWVEIEGENFVADTFMGVKALYNEGNRNHQCGDLIIRFYKEALGIEYDAELNAKSRGKEVKISTENSKIQVWIVPTNEELVIARDTVRLLGIK